MKISASVNDISMKRENNRFCQRHKYEKMKINASVNDISMDKEKLKDVVKNHEY